MFLILILCVGAQLNDNPQHKRHRKDIEFVQVSADIQDKKLQLEGIIQQVNQLALTVQRQNFFDDSIKRRPIQLLQQLDAISGQKSNEEIKIIDSLKYQLNIIQQTMNKEDSIQECDDQIVCKICQSNVYYILDEDNWYMIGFEHGFKKEFQFLLDGAKSLIGQSNIELSFSHENHICLQFSNMKNTVNLDAILQQYIGKGLQNYENKWFALPKFGIPGNILQNFKNYQKKIENKQFTYRDMIFEIIDSSQKDIQGGRINKINFKIEDQEVIQQYEGNFYQQQNSYSFNYFLGKGQEQQENIQIKYSKELSYLYAKQQLITDGRYSRLSSNIIVNQTDIIFDVEFD